MSVTDLARELVAVPSHEDESAAGDLVEDWLADETDGSVERDGAGNVVARRNAGADRSLALVGHHDVVPPDDDQIEDGDYVVAERDGRLYGRGTADMKGSVAAAMVAFRDADVHPGTELVFVSFAGEESGGVGCRAAIDDGFAPDYAVVGEGSTSYSAEGVTDVAVAHKGRRGSTVLAEGASSHASEPEAGENAIYRAADAVDVVRDLDAPETEVLGHHLGGSVVVTEIDGGSAWNVVPERCEFTVDERTVPGERAALERAESVEGVTWEVDQDLPPMACDDPDFAEAVVDAAAASQDGDPRQVVKPHATDAGWLADRAGTTCVVCGAAEPGEAHTADESVSLEVIERCAALYRRVAEADLD
ncbi:M20/M25/M40 family metallo-hydrolase [Natronomonas salina]|uniref:M20 family metallopeptidase n=1 Tax=Natronomonas salina TaxID=1710540 RepID=UPI0015B5EFAD|nr:M20/M25/M40 family metallo-hydrolase [Natronomonas salina]QLD89820.1 M20/M25/M40 family metallo-hydrolase [Natronomonas salina]